MFAGNAMMFAGESRPGNNARARARTDSQSKNNSSANGSRYNVALENRTNLPLPIDTSITPPSLPVDSQREIAATSEAKDGNGGPTQAHSLSANMALNEMPPLSDPGHLLDSSPSRSRTRNFRFKRVGIAAYWDKVEDTPKLPEEWRDEHDRAICYLDLRGYDAEEMVTRLRNYFPELRGILTPHMVDKRLRQLDQDPTLTYWADAMRDLELMRSNIGNTEDETAFPTQSSTSSAREGSVGNVHDAQVSRVQRSGRLCLVHLHEVFNPLAEQDWNRGS